MNVWQIGVDNIPDNILGRFVKFRQPNGDIKDFLVGEAMGYRAGQFIVEVEEGVYEFQGTDPRLPEEAQVPVAVGESYPAGMRYVQVPTFVRVEGPVATYPKKEKSGWVSGWRRKAKEDVKV